MKIKLSVCYSDGNLHAVGDAASAGVGRLSGLCGQRISAGSLFVYEHYVELSWLVHLAMLFNLAEAFR